ncbi:MAG: metallophosphoesterase [Bacteroidales bacterium]|nr:metallophosphoesterase [Bacteroidales bacterium]
MKKLLFSFWIVLFIIGINPVAGQTLMPKGSVWKYMDDGSDQGTAWKEVSFDDATWNSGPAILGYGTMGNFTISTYLSYGVDASNKYATTYFRSTFDYTPSVDETSIIFDVLVDDGAIIYINGQEIFRIGIAEVDVYYNTYGGSGDESAYQRTIIPIDSITDILSEVNVIAVEVHQSSPTSSDIGLDIEISSSVEPIPIPPNISQIRFGSLGDPLNGLTVTWRSSGIADSIAWGYTNDFVEGKFEALQRENTFGVSVYDYTFPTLTEASTIYYSLFDSKDTIWSVEKTFNTASNAPNDKFSFTAFGDSRSDPDQWHTMSEATLDTDFTLFMGDIIADGAILTGWDLWYEYGEEFISSEPIYHTIGNHDEDNSSSGFEAYLGMFTLPGEETYYSFNYGNAVFICLNSEDPGNYVQYQWLLETLEANKDKTWKFVFFHRPFYTGPSHVGEMDSYFNTWWKALDDYGVDMTFHGHTHNYQRTKPINRNVSTSSPVTNYGSLEGMGRCQIVTGGAGVGISGPADPIWWLEKSVGKHHFCNIDIDGDKLTLKAIDENLVVFDELVLDKSTMGISDLRPNKKIVFPNPSDGVFYIKVPDDNTFSYRIFNSTGHLISEVQNHKGTVNPILIELSIQPMGIYYIELKTDKETSVEKIILY